MEIDIEKFLDWLVKLDVSHYKEKKESGLSNYTLTGKSHFYLKGSQERFTSEDMINIYSNTASDETNENWQNAITENMTWQQQ